MSIGTAEPNYIILSSGLLENLEVRIGMKTEAAQPYYVILYSVFMENLARVGIKTRKKATVSHLRPKIM